MTLWIELAAFVIGLLVGSFLNVCISRLPWHESIVHPRSHCPRCLHAIRWYDNVPLLSFVILRGKCRDCKAKIPWRYPVVEIAAALWLLSVVFLAQGVIWVGINNLTNQELASTLWTMPSVAMLGLLLIGLLVMDWQTHTLPDAFTLPGIAIGFLLVCVQAVFLAPGEYDIKLNPLHSLRMSSPGSFVAKGNVFLTGPEHLVFGRLVAILAAGGILVLVRAFYKAVRHREGLGLGDAKLLAMIAAFLGFAPAVFALFVALVLVLPYALFLLLAAAGPTATTQLPFGSFRLRWRAHRCDDRRTGGGLVSDTALGEQTANIVRH